MTALLIDDEPAANVALSSLLQRYHPEVIIVGTAASLGDGLKKVNQLRPDLLFLDVNLPDGKGFDLVRNLAPDIRPEVIFVTSEDSYLKQAIRIAAVGYVVKPVAVDELKTSMDNARVRIRQRNSETRLQAMLDNLEDDNLAKKRVGIPSDRGVEFVMAGDILYCEGVDGYTSIKLKDDTNRLSSYSIGEFRKILEPLGFFAVHRSYLANRAHISGWDGGLQLNVANRATIPVSRRRKPEVISWLDAK